jgi:hypothetical protein
VRGRVPLAARGEAAAREAGRGRGRHGQVGDERSPRSGGGASFCRGERDRMSFGGRADAVQSVAPATLRAAFLSFPLSRSALLSLGMLWLVRFRRGGTGTAFHG